VLKIPDVVLAQLSKVVAGVRPQYNVWQELLRVLRLPTLFVMALGRMALIPASTALRSAIAENANSTEEIACGARALEACQTRARSLELWVAMLSPLALAISTVIARLAPTPLPTVDGAWATEPVSRQTTHLLAVPLLSLTAPAASRPTASLATKISRAAFGATLSRRAFPTTERAQFLTKVTTATSTAPKWERHAIRATISRDVVGVGRPSPASLPPPLSAC